MHATQLCFSYSVDYACTKQQMRVVCRFGDCRCGPDGFAVALVRFPAAGITDEFALSTSGSRPIRLMGSNYSREAQEGSVSEIVPCRMLGRAVGIILGEHDPLWCFVFGAAIARRK